MLKGTRKLSNLQSALVWVLDYYAQEFSIDESEALQWLLTAGVESLLKEARDNGVEIPIFDGHISSDIDSSDEL